MDIRDMIRNAFSGDATEFQNTFNTIMQDKMAAAIQARHDEMFDVDTETEEDLEPEIEETQDEEV